jgi:tetratricopeptide (TPR) repeat protein
MHTEPHSISNQPSDAAASVGPWPLYALIAVGLVLGGIFPWFMLACAVYKNNSQKKSAFFIATVNLCILGLFTWYLSESGLIWWQLDILIYVFNLVWTLSAFYYQKKTMASCPKRYAWDQWRSWISPLLIAVLIGMGLGLLTMVPNVLRDRMVMGQTFDALARETVLWDFFKYSLVGLPVGLLLGLWWAGEQRRFGIAHMVTFLSAFTLMFLCWAAVSSLLSFMLTQGRQSLNADEWALIPPWTSGIAQHFLFFQNHNPLGYIVVPLLFGAVSRIRDFWKKTVLIPLSFCSLLPMLYSDHTFWSLFQERIVYEMTAPDKKARDSAHHRVEILLKRYPQHLRRPDLTEDLAYHYYQQGAYTKARAYYQTIVDRYADSKKWYWSVQYARSALQSPGFGKPAEVIKLEIPLVDYERYLTHNWMALLSVIRFWEGTAVSESQIKIRLRNLSLSDDRIQLSPLANPADLDDAAHNLHYEMLILPAEKNKIENLLKAGIPVLLQSYNSFDLFFGLDPGRSMFCAYSFQELSVRLTAEARREAEEILSLEKEDQNQSRERLDRIAREAYVEYPQARFDEPSQRFRSPFIAVIYPAGQSALIGRALQTPLTALQKESDGLLSALIGFSFLQAGDLLQATTWAQKSTENTGDPLPYYVAHLVQQTWDKRTNKIPAGLPLERQFPELDRISRTFTEPRNQKFFEQSAQAFQKGLNHDSVPWTIVHYYLNLLRADDPRDRESIKACLNGILQLDPAYDFYWESLVDVYDWDRDPNGRIRALQALVSAAPLNFDAKLRLAYHLVLKEEYMKAKEILEQIDPAAVRYNADYAFCCGAIAEWEGHTAQALKHYRRAVENRHYRPVFHLKYGSLLLKKGLKAEALKELHWAVSIDADGEIKKQAEALLTEFSNTKENK